MKKQSAGILLYRKKNNSLEVLLAHPGGPLWAKKDEGVWTIPKGEFGDEENPLEAAKREFREETGFDISGHFIELTPVRQKSGKLVYAWAVEGDLDVLKIVSNTFELEWPPKSGRKQSFPEIDRAQWFGIDTAKKKMNERQVVWIDELLMKLRVAR